jgi:hypothetical protein
MKYLFLFAALSAFGVASAQDDNNNFKKLLENYQKKNAVTVPGPQPRASLLTDKNYSFSLTNGNKVHRLPQDNMPCLAPDMKQFNMPNAGSPYMIKKGKNVIPDPSRPTFQSVVGEDTASK